MKLQAEIGMQYAYLAANDGLCLALQTSLPLEDLPSSGPGSASDPCRKTCILLMHGFSGSSAYFTRNYRSLSEVHWVVAPDMRGHGASGRCKGGYHVARLAADLRSIITRLRQTRPGVRIVPVGCSIGAAVLWTYTELFGDDEFAGLVFVDQAPLQDRSSFGGGWGAAKSHTGCYDEATLLAAQQDWVDDPRRAHVSLVRGCLGYWADPEGEDTAGESKLQDLEFFTAISGLCDPVWLARLLADHTRYDHREAIEDIRKPTLVIAGRRSGCFPLGGTEETVRRVNEGSGIQDLARWSVFDSGHWMFYEEADRFNREIVDFVAKCQ